MAWANQPRTSHGIDQPRRRAPNPEGSDSNITPGNGQVKIKPCTSSQCWHAVFLFARKPLSSNPALCGACFFNDPVDAACTHQLHLNALRLSGSSGWIPVFFTTDGLHKTPQFWCTFCVSTWVCAEKEPESSQTGHPNTILLLFFTVHVVRCNRNPARRAAQTQHRPSCSECTFCVSTWVRLC